MHTSPNDVPVTARAAPADAENDGERTIAFRRSQRASRERRHTAALRRRRTRRGRRSVAAAIAGLAFLSAGAFADGSGGTEPLAPDLSKQTIQAAQRALGVEDDGVAGPRTRRATRRFQRTHGLSADGILGPETLQALGVAQPTRAARAAEPGDAATLERIAQCESEGDPTAVSPNGHYRGKYQFDRKTWRSVGGSGDPIAAPEDEQDRRALRLLRRDGTTPWPNCA